MPGLDPDPRIIELLHSISLSRRKNPTPKNKKIIPLLAPEIKMKKTAPGFNKKESERLKTKTVWERIKSDPILHEKYKLNARIRSRIIYYRDLELSRKYHREYSKKRYPIDKELINKKRRERYKLHIEKLKQNHILYEKLRGKRTSRSSAGSCGRRARR